MADDTRLTKGEMVLFDLVQDSYSSIGAGDSEARIGMEQIMNRAREGKPYPKSGNFFELYQRETSEGEDLFREANAALHQIGRMVYARIRLQGVSEALTGEGSA